MRVFTFEVFQGKRTGEFRSICGDGKAIGPIDPRAFWSGIDSELESHEENIPFSENGAYLVIDSELDEALILTCSDLTLIWRL